MLLLLDVLDRWGRSVCAEVEIRRDTVEIRCQDTLAGVADREVLRAWLRDPDAVYAYDDLMWLRTGNGIALAIGDIVPAWPLADHIVHSLRERI